jgi:hypothetical protein
MTDVRIASHVHSSWSYDGEWALPDIAEAFHRRGYDVVLMAEHDRTFDQARWQEYQHACAQASRSDLLLVPGIEYEDADNVVHIPAWGPDIPFLGAGRPTIETLQAAAEHEAVALLAHPRRRDAAQRFSPSWAPLLSGVEIWNRKADGFAPARSGHALARRHGLAPFVSLDFHSPRQFFPLAMAATLDEAPSTASVVAAIRARRCTPEFLGTPAMRFLSGPEGAAVRGLERARRTLRVPVRLARHAIA